MLKLKNALHDIFITSITIKGIYGILELLGGFSLILIKSHFITSIIKTIFQNELIEDPKDYIANHLVQLAQNVSINTMTFATIYLIIHGIINVGLFLGLKYKKLWAYPTAAILLSLFVVYQFIRFFSNHSIILLILTIVDILIVLLLREEYNQLRHSNK